MQTEELQIVILILGFLMMAIGGIGFLIMVKKNKVPFVLGVICSILLALGSYLFFGAIHEIREPVPTPLPPIPPDSVIGYITNLVS